MRWFAGFDDVEIAALCDVDGSHLGRAMRELYERRPRSRTEAYLDFRRVLDRPDIDAVTCATPDHWHALVAAMAFQSGKDVYGEKPLTYCAQEGRAMLDALERNDRVFQLGTQIHAGDNYHRVVELVRSGGLGEVRKVHLWKTGGSPGLGFPANETPPATLDWDMWLGPAPEATYNPVRCHRTYRHFLEYSGGVYQDFWCHIADVVFWALEPKGLRRVSARGESPWDGIADAPAWIDVDFAFDDLDIHWTTEPPDVPGAADRGIGACFVGTEGSLVCDYDTREIRLGGEVLEDVPEVPQTIPRSPGHQRNFLDSVKSRTPPESNLHYARRMALPMHLGLISWRLARSLDWDDEKERFVSDPAADYLLSRDYRAPWTLG
jgi:predicted dehydrogenase